MKKHLPIGTRVKFTRRAIKVDNNGNSISTNDTPIGNTKFKIGVGKTLSYHKEGIIVGGTYLQEGNIHHNYDDGAQWETGKQHFVYLVRPAFTMRPIKVFPEDIEGNSKDWTHNKYLLRTDKLPFSGSGFQWNEASKKEQSEIMRNIPRDEKGRWK